MLACSAFLSAVTGGRRLITYGDPFERLFPNVCFAMTEAGTSALGQTRSGLTADVLSERFYFFLLIGNDRLHQVAY